MKNMKQANQKYLSLSTLTGAITGLSLTLSGSMIGCSPKPTSTPDRISNPVEGENLGAADTAPLVDQEWIDFEGSIQNDLWSLFTAQGTSEQLDHLNEKETNTIDLHRSNFAHEFIQSARRLSLERAKEYFEELKKDIQSNLDADIEAGILGSSVSDVDSDGERAIITHVYGVVQFHLDRTKIKMKREADGFLLNAYNDAKAATVQALNQLDHVTAVSETIDRVSEKGLQAIKPSFRPIQDERNQEITEEHMIRGGVSATGAGIAAIVDHRVGRSGYRALVQSHEPQHVINALLNANDALNEKRVRWGKARNEFEALRAEKIKLENTIREAGTQRAHFETEMASHSAQSPDWIKAMRASELEKIKINNANDAWARLKPAYEALEAKVSTLETEFKTYEAKATAEVQYSVQNRAFKPIEGGFKTQEELIASLRKAHYGDAHFSIVRTGARWVLKSASVAMAGVALAELVPLMVGQEIVWVPKDISASLSGTTPVGDGQ